jgi:hypothetical protein
MRQSEPAVPKIDKSNGTLTGGEGVVAVIAEVVPALQPTTVEPKHAI